MSGQSGILEIDLHGLRAEEAKGKIDSVLRKAAPAVYRIRCIHGYHRGSSLRQMIRLEYGSGLHPEVIRIVCGANEGITELVLREY